MRKIIRENYRHLGVVTHPVLHEMLDALEVVQSPNLKTNTKSKIFALNKVIGCIKKQSNLLEFEDVLIALEDIIADIYEGFHLIWEEDLVNLFFDILDIETGETNSLLSGWDFNKVTNPSNTHGGNKIVTYSNTDVKTLIKQWPFKEDKFKEYEEYE